MAQSATLLPSGVMKLESKESIQEIKDLKNNLTQAEARLITQVSPFLQKRLLIGHFIAVI